jgi:hypothetical protein
VKALGVVMAMLACSAAPALADDTRVGLTVVAGDAAISDDDDRVAGTQAAVVHSIGRWGIAAEGTIVALSSMREGGAIAGIAGRLRVFDGTTMFTAENGARSRVTFGLEVECVVQREWWDVERDMMHATRNSYGVGLGATISGADRGRFVGFRASVRVLASPRDDAEQAARMLDPMMEAKQPLGVLFTLGTELGVLR